MYCFHCYIFCVDFIPQERGERGTEEEENEKEKGEEEDGAEEDGEKEHGKEVVGGDTGVGEDTGKIRTGPVFYFNYV